jgi:hypothetical protein
MEDTYNNSNINVTLTDINAFDNIITNLNNSLNRINDNFSEEQAGVNSVLGNSNSWSGRAQTKAQEKYTEITNMYPSIIASLTNFINFLQDTSNNYKEFEKEINDNIEQNLDSLNVNS